MFPIENMNSINDLYAETHKGIQVHYRLLMEMVEHAFLNALFEFLRHIKF